VSDEAAENMAARESTGRTEDDFMRRVEVAASPVNPVTFQKFLMVNPAKPLTAGLLTVSFQAPVALSPGPVALCQRPAVTVRKTTVPLQWLAVPRG
jgi:hypothetical protein